MCYFETNRHLDSNEKCRILGLSCIDGIPALRQQLHNNCGHLSVSPRGKHKVTSTSGTEITEDINARHCSSAERLLVQTELRR